LFVCFPVYIVVSFYRLRSIEFGCLRFSRSFLSLTPDKAGRILKQDSLGDKLRVRQLSRCALPPKQLECSWPCSQQPTICIAFSTLLPLAQPSARF